MKTQADASSDRFVFGIASAPGSGKSTITDRLSREMDALVVPMDGFHFPNIVNTMALSIHERTKELGLLRAVGMSQRQLRNTIRFRSTIIALIGTLVGLDLGLFLGLVASKAAGDVCPDFAVPINSLVIIAVVGIAAGLVAGLLPARRAGKLNVLDAIAGE